MNIKYARLGLMLFAMIFILVVALQNHNLIMAMAGLFGIPVLFLPYLIEDWYLPYQRKKKAEKEEKANEAFRTAVNKHVQNNTRQPERAIPPVKEETSVQNDKDAAVQTKKDVAVHTKKDAAVSAKKEAAVPEGEEEKTVCTLEDLRISDEVCMSEVFSFNDEKIEKIISEFFSGDMIRNIYGGILSPEEKLKAFQQITGYGRQWDRGIRRGVNHEGYFYKPGSVSHMFYTFSAASFCLDGGNYMEDGYDEHKIMLTFCFDAEADWDRDILPKWQRRLQAERSRNRSGGSMIREDREQWGYNGKLEDSMIEARVIDEGRLYLKNPFGMGGVFHYEYEHTVD